MTYKNILSGLAVTGVALFLAVQSVSGATTSGVMTGNETWSGNVTLSGDVTVPLGYKLTILSGTRIAATAGSDDRASGANANRIELIVKGVVEAVGTSNNPIVFTSTRPIPPALPGDWQGIEVEVTNQEQSVFAHCIVEYAVDGLAVSKTSGLGQSTNSMSVISNCTFRSALACGVRSSGPLHLWGCLFTGCEDGIRILYEATMSDCVSVSNRYSGAYLEGNASLTATKSLFATNGSYGICGTWAFGHYLLTLQECHVVSNFLDGVYLDGYYGSAVVELRDSEFSRNGTTGFQLTRPNPSGFRQLLAQSCEFSSNGRDGEIGSGFSSGGANWVGNFVDCVATNNAEHGFFGAGNLTRCNASFNGLRKLNSIYRGGITALGNVIGCRVVGNGGDRWTPFVRPRGAETKL